VRSAPPGLVEVLQRKSTDSAVRDVQCLGFQKQVPQRALHHLHLHPHALLLEQ